MHEGKISQNVLKRNVLKFTTPEGTRNVLSGAGIGNDYGCLSANLSENENGAFLFLSASHSLTVLAPEEPKAAVVRCANDLFCACELGKVVLQALQVDVVLPFDGEEASLRSIMKTLKETAAEPGIGVPIVGGHTTVAGEEDGLKVPVVSLFMTGLVICDQKPERHPSVPGQDIVITEHIAMDGTARLVELYGESLGKRYRSDFLDGALALGQNSRVSLKKQAELLTQAREKNVFVPCGVHNVSEGGILGALWEYAQRSGVGFEVDMKALPICQETVEISEFCRVNPYLLQSAGAMIFSCDCGEEAVNYLQQNGISAVVVGRTTDSNDRLLINDGEKRYLDLPAEDEIYRKRRV